MKLNSPHLAPQYAGRNFANFPPTLTYWLTGEGAPALAPEVLPSAFARRYDLVILLFIDSLGWEMLEPFADESPLLRRFARDGVLTKITSQFPSTTAAHVTCIHTGLPVGQSGIYEWQYYEPKLDAVITPLLFSKAGTLRRDTLKPLDVDPATIYPSETLYASLATRGVVSHTFGSREITPSTYSERVMRGANVHPFRTWSEGVVNLAETAYHTNAPAYLFIYHGDVDLISHHHGPSAVHTRAQIDETLHTLERWLLPSMRTGNKKALLVLTADHGQMRVSRAETRFLNLDPRTREVVPWLRTDAAGNVLVPAGSPRDSFLYVREDRLDDAYALLSEALQEDADVVKTNELVAQGYFGKPPVCADLLARLGNLTILPHANKCVWWYEKDKFDQRYLGQHGGLSPTEMEIPLALLDLSA